MADTAQLDRDRLQLNLLFRFANLLLFLACMFGGGGLYCDLMTLLLQFLYRIVSDVLVALTATWPVLVPVASVNMPEEAFGVVAVSTALENVQVLASFHALEAHSAPDLGCFQLNLHYSLVLLIVFRLSIVTIVTFEVLPLSDAFFNFDVLPRSVAVRVRERLRRNTGVIWVGEAERDYRVTVALLIVWVNTQ